MAKNSIKIAGKDYDLAYDFQSFYEMESLHGVNVFDPEIFHPNPRTLAVLLWGGCRRCENPPSLDDVVKGLTLIEARDAQLPVLFAVKEALPKKTKGNDRV